jgi:hypothetical protein
LQFGVVGFRDVADELKEGGHAAFRRGLDAELRKRLDDELAEITGDSGVPRGNAAGEERLQELARGTVDGLGGG